MQVVVSSKGQVTIPALLRKIFDIKPKNKVTFKVVKEGILIVKSSSATQALFGAAARGKQIPFTPLVKVRQKAGQKLGERFKVKT